MKVICHIWSQESKSCTTQIYASILWNRYSHQRQRVRTAFIIRSPVFLSLLASWSIPVRKNRRFQKQLHSGAVPRARDKLREQRKACWLPNGARQLPAYKSEPLHWDWSSSDPVRDHRLLRLSVSIEVCLELYKALKSRYFIRDTGLSLRCCAASKRSLTSSAIRTTRS